MKFDITFSLEELMCFTFKVPPYQGAHMTRLDMELSLASTSRRENAVAIANMLRCIELKQPLNSEVVHDLDIAQKQLDLWLVQLETETKDEDAEIVFEACKRYGSGYFILEINEVHE